jgi:hypothetical protein
MGSDALAPAFVHNVFDPLEIGGAQRCDAVIRAIDDFGETRQFDLLGLGKQIWIKLLKQPMGLLNAVLLALRRRQMAPTIVG